MISQTALTAMVMIALVFASATPIILITLVYRDWKDGKLW